MELDSILQPIVDAIDDAKGLNVDVLDVQEMTDVTDHMVVVSGSSVRHVKSIMRSIVQRMSDLDHKPSGLEGDQHAQWILLDYNDVVIHIMLTEVREFYDLERLWNRTLKRPSAVPDD